jgi:hypothetical protein
MPTLNGTWHNENTPALREVRAVRTDPLAGVRLDKRVLLYLTDMGARRRTRFVSRADPRLNESQISKTRSEQFPSLETDCGGSEPQVRREPGTSPVLDWRTST